MADLDPDGSADIIVTGCFLVPDMEGWVIAYECSTAGPACPIWNQYGYHVNNVNDDGTIPVTESPSWRTHNTWLAQYGSADCSFDEDGDESSDESGDESAD